MSRALWVAGICAVALVVVVAAGGLHGLFTPADAEGATRTFVVAPGEALGAVAQRLQDDGLLARSPLFGPWTLVVYARARGLDREMKSGEYDLSPTLTPVEILDKIVSGSVKTYAVTLPEGLHLGEVALRLEREGIASSQEILELARDPGFAHTLGIAADSLEGYLYPETYRFRRATPADEVLRRMVEEFHEAWTEGDRARLEASGLALHEVVTLASIVEKETGAAEERPRIAAVFLNRLKRRMRLQSDPTVIYGILATGGEFHGNLRRRDLETDTPYNTYTRGGLPPGPIASTGMASIRAVLEPADVPYLYFVSRNDGTHVFSTNLRDHTNAVNRYQKGGQKPS